MNETLIDPDAWETMKAMTDPAFLAELIDIYLNDAPQLIEQMHTALATGDIEVVRRAAHSLKSNSASFGAKRLADASRELEMLAKSGTITGADLKLAEIEQAYSQLAPRLLELKNER